MELGPWLVSVIFVTRFLKIRWEVLLFLLFVLSHPHPSVFSSWLFIFLLYLSPSLFLPLCSIPPPRHPTLPIALLPPPPLLSCPVAFSDAVIHSCSRHCLVVMWPKPAWQHGEQHGSGCCACPAHAHTLSCKHTHTHSHAWRVTLANAHVLSFSDALTAVHVLRNVSLFYHFINITNSPCLLSSHSTLLNAWWWICQSLFYEIPAVSKVQPSGQSQ